MTRRTIIAGSVLVFATTAVASAEEYLAPVGGGGGGQFANICSHGGGMWGTPAAVTGLKLTTGDDIDSVTMLCGGPVRGSVLMSRDAQGERHGGNGGGPVNVLCDDPARPFVIGMDVTASGVDTLVVKSIHLFCGNGSLAQPAQMNPSAIFDGPPDGNTGLFGRSPTTTHGELRCPAGEVAIGIHGRSGIWVDAISLICGPPPPPLAAPAPAERPKPVIPGPSTTLKKEPPPRLNP